MQATGEVLPTSSAMCGQKTRGLFDSGRPSQSALGLRVPPANRYINILSTYGPGPSLISRGWRPSSTNPSRS